MTAAVDSAAASTSNVLVHLGNDGIARLTLNRPEKYNTLSVALMAELQDTLDRLSVNRSVRVVILAGSGKAYSAGHDLAELQACPSKDEAAALFTRCSQLMLAVTRLPQPVIACVNGTCTAAGTQLVAACDLAVATDTARFAVSGINLGLFCSTPMVALTRNIPRKAAMEMLLTGEFIDAATALRLGLLNRVAAEAELDAVTEALAVRIARQSPAAIALGKQLFYRQIEAGIEAAYSLATETMARNLIGEDARAGIEAFIAKRPMPEWSGR